MEFLIAIIVLTVIGGAGYILYKNNENKIQQEITKAKSQAKKKIDKL